MPINTATLDDIPAYLLAYRKETEAGCKHGEEPCAECLHKRLHGRRWMIENRERHREQVRGAARKMRARDPVGYREKALEWQRKNNEKVIGYRRTNYARHGKKYRERYRGKGYRHNLTYRARKAGAFIEQVHWRDIYERDKGICGICGLHVPRASASPLLHPSLDHKVPLVSGGKHEGANAQLAHRACNSQKNTKRSVPEEMRVRLVNRIGALLMAEDGKGG